MSFFGNPNVTITAIDTSGGIACSRTSGQTPCFIQVSASAITATGTSVPYEDLDYSWNFGDPNGAEIFTHPVTLTADNQNSSKTGPEAEYCYRSAGTYTVTLTVRGKNGSGFTTAQVTRDITVTAYSASGGDWYFDSSAAGGGNGSIGLPFNTVAQISTKAQVANASLHLKRGSGWVGSSIVDLGGQALRMDAYGSGAKPILNISSGSAAVVRYAPGLPGAVTRGDIVISGVELRRSGSATGELFNFTISDPNLTFANAYLDNCDYVSDLAVTAVDVGWGVFQAHGNGTDGSKVSNFGIWGGSFSATATDAARGIAFYGGARNWSFFVGFAVSGTGNSDIFDHHLYPNVQNHSHHDYITFGQGAGRNFCINGNWDTVSGSLELARYHSITNSYFTGTLRAFDIANGDNDPSTVQFSNFAVQGNAFAGLTGFRAILINCAESLTFRYNNIWGCDAGEFWAAGFLALSLDSAVYRIYKNNAYIAGSADSPFWNMSAHAWTQAHQFTDNVCVDIRAVAQLVKLDSFSNEQSIGTIIDRNQYYIPNDTDSKAWYDSTTPKTFAQWQAFGFDVNGSVANPGWNNPAIGDFSVYVGFSSGLAAPGTPNTQSQFGLRHVGYLSGSPDYQFSVRSIQSSYATAIYYGDPVVKLASTQYIAPALGNQTTLMGVFQGCMYWPKVGNMPVWSRFWPGGPQRTDATAYIVDAPTALFLSAALLTAVPSSAVGQNIGFALGSAPSTAGPGYSTYVVDQSTLTTGSAEPFQVYAIYQGVGNGSDRASNYNWVVVCFNNERFRTQTGNA